MKKVTFIVPRIEKFKISTVALVTAEVGSENLTQENAIRAALERALSKWFTTCDEGYEAWQQSCQDFNVGDLAAELPADGKLKDNLELEQIFNLTVEIFGGDGGDWLFDTVLGDGGERDN